ncbi:MAG: glycosyltransferase family 4 protein [Hyphomicrobium sp.]
MSRPRVCFVTATPLSLHAFLRDHIANLAQKFDVTAISSFSADELTRGLLPNVRLVPCSIARPIAPVADARALFALVRHFRAERYDAVHSITPKAGLLAMTAARMTGVTHRIHCFTGQVWATRKGSSRAILKGADRLITANATRILADSHSQLEFLEGEGVVSRGGAAVLGRGSIAGVDLDRFRPDEETRWRIRDELGVPQQACLLLFIGRVNRDKGVLDLAQAFARLTAAHEDVWLAMVGPDEANLSAEIVDASGNAAARLLRVDYTATPEHYMAAADVLVLPSYREGFGNVVIEAAACGIPSVASRIYGLTDAVVDGATGLLHPPRDIAALTACLDRICTDGLLRGRLGQNARQRVRESYSMQSVVDAMGVYYTELFGMELK